MMPAKLVESKSFAEFLECLNPHFKLSSRRSYMRNVKNTFEEMETGLIFLLSNVEYMATTGTLKFGVLCFS